jgi:hypothetical protein
VSSAAINWNTYYNNNSFFPKFISQKFFSLLIFPYFLISCVTEVSLMIEPQMIEPSFQGARGTHGDSNSKDWGSKASMGMYRHHQLSIQRAVVQPLLKILVKKNSYLVPFEHTSPGEKYRNLLLLTLIPKSCPMLIDQPEDNLDFQVKNQLPQIISDQRNQRQFFIITHFQNILVLTDAEKIILFEEDTKHIKIKEGTFVQWQNILLPWKVVQGL